MSHNFEQNFEISAIVVRWPTFLSDDVLILEIDCTMLHLPPLTTVKDKVKLTMTSKDRVVGGGQEGPP